MKQSLIPFFQKISFKKQILCVSHMMLYTFTIASCNILDTEKSTETPQKQIQKDSFATIISPPREDAKYGKQLSLWRRHAMAYENLNLDFEIAAILISPKMQEAYLQRKRLIMSEDTFSDKIISTEGSRTLNIVVDLYTRSSVYRDLTDTSTWHISLTARNQKLKPIKTELIKQKDKLLPFFPEGSSWSRFFIVSFSLPPSTNLENIFACQEEKEQEELIFSMHSGHMHARFSWSPCS